MGTVETSLPPTVEFNSDQALADGQQVSPGKQRHVSAFAVVLARSTAAMDAKKNDFILRNEC